MLCGFLSAVISDETERDLPTLGLQTCIQPGKREGDTRSLQAQAFCIPECSVPSVLQRIHKGDGLPRWLHGKVSTCEFRSWRRCKFNPWIGKIPWRRKQQPLPVFLSGKSCGQKNLVGYSPRGHTESDTIEHAHTHTWGGVQRFWEMRLSLSSAKENDFAVIFLVYSCSDSTCIFYKRCWLCQQA